jgi:hypothetical protein
MASVYAGGGAVAGVQFAAHGSQTKVKMPDLALLQAPIAVFQLL